MLCQRPRNRDGMIIKVLNAEKGKNEQKRKRCGCEDRLQNPAGININKKLTDAHL